MLTQRCKIPFNICSVMWAELLGSTLYLLFWIKALDETNETMLIKHRDLTSKKKKKAVSKTFLFQIITFQRRFLITGIVSSTTTGSRKKSPSSMLLREISPTWKTSQYCLSTGDLIPCKSYVHTCFPRFISKGDPTGLAQLAIECSQKYST